MIKDFQRKYGECIMSHFTQRGIKPDIPSTEKKTLPQFSSPVFTEEIQLDFIGKITHVQT